MTLPMYMLVTTPQKKSGLSVKRSGPGRNPYIIRAPIKIATVADEGMPSVNSGTSAPPVAALFAVSAAQTPSIAPCPNLSGVLEAFFSAAYAMKAETVAPAPGKDPMRKPMIVERTIVHLQASQSDLVGKTRPDLRGKDPFRGRTLKIDKYFAKGKKTHGHGDKPDAVQQVRPAKREPLDSGHRVKTDGSDQHSQKSHPQTLKKILCRPAGSGWPVQAA